MEKQEYKSKWDELAREIGAEIPPETIEREEAVAAPQPVPATRPTRSTEKPAAESRAVPKKVTPGWDSLAGELGLPPAPPEEKPVEARAEKPVAPRPEPRPEARAEPRRPEARQQEPRKSEERREPPRREESEPPRKSERAPREREERSERPSSRRGARSGERGQRSERPERPVRSERESRESRDSRRPPREADVETEAEAEREVRPRREVERAERRPEPPAAPAPPREEAAKPAAVSLWHKIFGSPAEQTAKLVDEEPLPDASEALGVDPNEPRSAGSGFADPHADEHDEAERGNEFEDDDRPEGDVSEEDESDRKRGRPRRRRGRGRGRRSETDQAEGRSTEQRESRGPRSERDADRPRPKPRTERAERDDEFDDLAVDDELGGLDDDDVEDGDEVAVGEGASPGRSTLARAIPSWDEAIGFIVDTNMQSRSQRRPPSRSGPRDNGGSGGRGRGRGRRKS